MHTTTAFGQVASVQTSASNETILIGEALVMGDLIHRDGAASGISVSLLHITDGTRPSNDADCFERHENLLSSWTIMWSKKGKARFLR